MSEAKGCNAEEEQLARHRHYTHWNSLTVHCLSATTPPRSEGSLMLARYVAQAALHKMARQRTEPLRFDPLGSQE
jgi:hypothetical protein